MNILRSCFGCFSVSQNDEPVVNPQSGRGDSQNLTPRVGNVDPESMRVVSKAVRHCEGKRAERKMIWESAGGDRRGRTPLHHAAIAGNLDQVQVLCGRGDDVNIADERGKTPLYLAVLNNQASIVSELLRRGAKLKSPAFDETKLACIAAKYGFEDVMRVLVGHNSESITRVSDRSGFSAVHEAAGENQVGILKLFVELGIGLGVKSDRMGSPLDVARRGKSWGAISYLKTPPRNDEAVQVIRGDRSLTPQDLERWAQTDNASGIEDLSSVIRAFFVARRNGDINEADNPVQNSLVKMFRTTVVKVARTFNISEGRALQFNYIDALSEFCKKKGILNDDGYLTVSESLLRVTGDDRQIENAATDFARLRMESIFDGESLY